MLGTEPQVKDVYVSTGQVKLVFWPVLNHSGSPFVHGAAECIAQQDINAFWEVHDYYFQNQGDLWSATRDYYINSAVLVGVDQAEFERCYDSGEGIAAVQALDEIRRDRGVFSQPTFDVNGQIFLGAQPFQIFAELFEGMLQ